jgi:N-acetylglucosaminyldiphosphoundecaprenol N-acetyl-beta-D-mannosaminyltransferase
MLKEKYLVNIKINSGYTYDTVLNFIDNALDSFKQGIICTTNPEFIVKALKDKSFAHIINNSLLSVPDGFGILLGLEFQKELRKQKKDRIYAFRALYIWLRLLLKSLSSKQSFQKTVTGVDLIHHICSYSVKNNKSIFLLGGWPKDRFGNMIKDTDLDLSSIAADKLRLLYPGIRIIGSTSKYSAAVSDDLPTVSYIHQCMEAVGAQNIDFMFVAYTFGSQEKWLQRNLPSIPASIGIGVGGSLDYISEYAKRPPQLIRDIHFEWLYRVLTQPYRLSRILIAFIVFPWTIYSKSI